MLDTAVLIGGDIGETSRNKLQTLYNLAARIAAECHYISSMPINYALRWPTVKDTSQSIITIKLQVCTSLLIGNIKLAAYNGRHNSD